MSLLRKGCGRNKCYKEDKMKMIFLTVCSLLILSSSYCGHAIAAMRYSEHLARLGIEEQKKNSVLIVDVITKDIKETNEVRASEYLQYVDYGLRIKTKERKILVYCTIISIKKNKTDLILGTGDELVATFWKQVEGPISNNYREGWENPPKENEDLQLLFIESNILKKEGTIELLPTFIYRLSLKWDGTSIDSLVVARVGIYYQYPKQRKIDDLQEIRNVLFALSNESAPRGDQQPTYWTITFFWQDRAVREIQVDYNGIWSDDKGRRSRYSSLLSAVLPPLLLAP